MLPHDTLDYNVTDFLTLCVKLWQLGSVPLTAKCLHLLLYQEEVSTEQVYTVVHCLLLYTYVRKCCVYVQSCVYVMLHHVEADNATAGCVTLCVLFVYKFRPHLPNTIRTIKSS